MSDCERLESTLAAYVGGELSETELGPLLAHCRSCRDCRQLLELHRDLTGLASRGTAPDRAEFDALHARVLVEVSGRDGGRAQTLRSLWGSIPGGASLRFAATVALAALLFFSGVAAGRAFPGSADANGTGTVTNRLLTAISADAASNLELADVEDSRFTYSNVSLRRLDDDRVALGFDVTTHVDLVEPARSGIVREVLVHSLLNPSSTGTRLKAMSFATGAMEPKVEQALLFAMRRDDNLAVRLQALTILSDHLDSPNVQSAVLVTLRDDPSVQMRLMALDYLAAHSVDRDRIRQTIRENRRPGDEALIVRLAQYES